MFIFTYNPFYLRVECSHKLFLIVLYLPLVISRLASVLLPQLVAAGAWSKEQEIEERKGVLGGGAEEREMRKLTAAPRQLT